MLDLMTGQHIKPDVCTHFTPMPNIRSCNGRELLLKCFTYLNDTQEDLSALSGSAAQITAVWVPSFGS